jgi:hypothetical protein
MVDLDSFVLPENALPPLVPGEALPRLAGRYSYVSWSAVKAVQDVSPRHSAEFWALVILLGVHRENRVRYSRLREGDGWVRVSSALLPSHTKLPAKVKRAALALLDRTGLVETRRFPHASPQVRLKGQKRDTPTHAREPGDAVSTRV